MVSKECGLHYHYHGLISTNLFKTKTIRGLDKSFAIFLSPKDKWITHFDLSDLISFHTENSRVVWQNLSELQIPF